MLVRRFQMGQGIATATLVGGLALSLSQLWTLTRGASALLALSAGAIVLAFGPKEIAGRKLAVQAGLLLLAMALVSLLSGIPSHIGSALAWTGILVGILVGIGAVRLSRMSSSEPLIASEAPAVGKREPAFPVPVKEPVPTESVFEPPMEPEWPVLVDEGDFLDGAFEDEELEEPEEDRIVHAWTRRRHAEEEHLEGSVIAEFNVGQKQVYVHVPFLPGFFSRPQALCYCECDSLFSAEFDILQTYGGRLSVRRRGEVSHPAEVEIAFSVTAPLPAQRAA